MLICKQAGAGLRRWEVQSRIEEPMSGSCKADILDGSRDDDRPSLWSGLQTAGLEVGIHRMVLACLRMMVGL